MLHKLKRFTKKLSHGIKQELQETKEIPKHIQSKHYKKAAEQIGDIGKMTFLSFLWILPGGGILSATLVKFSEKFRPSAFKDKKNKNGDKNKL